MDPFSAIMTALALVSAVGALWGVRATIRARGARARLAWLGRSFALLGAAFSFWFPASLYGELLMVLPTGSDDVIWLPRAIWAQLAMMPLTVIPALVALRSTREGAVLFAIALLITIADELFQPFGVLFPDASHGLAAYAFTFGPQLLVVALLLAGRSGPAFGAPLSGRYLTLGPTT
jgi:hypothetical protein